MCGVFKINISDLFELLIEYLLHFQHAYNGKQHPTAWTRASRENSKNALESQVHLKLIWWDQEQIWPHKPALPILPQSQYTEIPGRAEQCPYHQLCFSFVPAANTLM